MDKMLCLCALTAMEKKIAEIRTRMSAKNTCEVIDFIEFDQMIIKMSLNLKVISELMLGNFRNADRLRGEVDKWEQIDNKHDGI